MQHHHSRTIALRLLLLMFASGSIVMATTPTPSPPPETTQEAPSALSLEAFSMPPNGIRGIAPVAWDELQPGTYIRDDAADINTTYIVYIANPGLTVAEAIEPLLAPLQLESLPESSGAYAGGAFDWTLYDVIYTPAELDGEALRVTLAIAESDDSVTIIVLQGQPQEFDALLETVLTPALDVFGLPLEDINTYLGIPSLTTRTIEAYDIEAQIPSDWREVNPGAYMRAQDAEDFTTLLVQSSPDLDERDFAALLLETLDMDVDLPDKGDAIDSDSLMWTHYRLDFEAQDVPVTMQIATASDDDRTYMVALLSDGAEAEVLYDEVLLPVVTSIRSST